jgi:hypothetical protein
MSQSGHCLGHYGQGAIDVGVGGVMAQGEPDRTARQGIGNAHGGEHMARLEGTTGTGGSTGDADPSLAQGEQQFLALDVIQTEVEVPGQGSDLRRHGSVRARNGMQEPPR